MEKRGLVSAANAMLIKSQEQIKVSESALGHAKIVRSQKDTQLEGDMECRLNVPSELRNHHSHQSNSPIRIKQPIKLPSKLKKLQKGAQTVKKNNFAVIYQLWTNKREMRLH